MIELELVKKSNEKVLKNLLQLYLHNISAYFPMPFNSESGVYDYDDISKYIEKDENSIAYFIKYEENIAGFILLDKIEEFNIVQEMFVMNNYKRTGIGKNAVKQLFNKYHGNWEIKSLPCSEQAEKFWVSVVKEYTKNNFDVKYVGKYNRAVISFDNKDYE
jgi:predicted acetyltransferase